MFPQLLTLLPSIFDKIWPDKTKADEAKARLIELQMNGELQQIMGQLEINKEEAKNSNLFVSGARPFILWTCGVSFAYAAFFEPILRFVASVYFGYSGQFPTINTDITMQILFGILGLGAFRTYEKSKGIAS